MMVVMEQQSNLKEEIVSAVVEHLSSFEERINKRMDDGFAKVDDRFAKVDKKFFSIDGQFSKIDYQFRKQGVILEDIQGKVQLLAEGQDVIHQRIDTLEVRVTALEER